MNPTPHDLAILGFCLFVTGIIFGIAFMAMVKTAVDDAKEKKHEATVVEQGKEIARLRAQVALHINEEK